MKFIPGPLASAMSGKLGGTVASHNRGGVYFRRRAKPTISTTPAAEAAKGRFAAVSGAWATLDVGAREAWTLWAANNPIVDRLGNKITLDGHAAYVRCNCLCEVAGTAAIDLPPVDPVPDALTTLSLTQTAVTFLIQLVWTPAPLVEPARIKLSACVTTSPARNYVKGKLKMVMITAAAATSPLEIRSLVEARIGTMEAGDILNVEASVYSATTGLESMALSAQHLLIG